MGISWYVGSDQVGRPTLKEGRRAKPILLMLPGLGGGYNNLYTHTLAETAMKQGFKCGVVNFRCAEGMPVTSYRVTCSASHDDAREVIDYVYNNYVVDS